MRLVWALLLCALLVFCYAKQVTLSNSTRRDLLANASLFLPDSSSRISILDPLAGPRNPYGLQPFQNLTCVFLEPDCADPEGGGTPKFLCNVNISGKQVPFNFKYDQQ
jgi:hypothetical protein